MSLLGQISVAQIGRIRTIGHAPSYVKGLTYDRVHEHFVRPHDALGNRYRNPVARFFEMVLGPFLVAQSEAVRACRYQVSRIFDMVQEQADKVTDIIIHRNPVTQTFDMVLGACRRWFSRLARIEIAIRIRPE